MPSTISSASRHGPVKLVRPLERELEPGCHRSISLLLITTQLGIAQSVELSTLGLRSPMNHCATVEKLSIPQLIHGSQLTLVVKYVDGFCQKAADMNASCFAIQVHAHPAPSL